MTKVIAETLKPGDTILPPPREIQLWMRRHCEERGLAESALHLTVTAIDEGMPDKKGRWLIIRTLHTPEWCANCVKTDPAAHPFNFKARPETLWARVQS